MHDICKLAVVFNPIDEGECFGQPVVFANSHLIVRGRKCSHYSSVYETPGLKLQKLWHLVLGKDTSLGSLYG